MAEVSKDVGNIFTTSGSILGVGEWIPSKPGIPVRITEEDLTELFNNSNGSIPLAIGHDDNSPTIGYITKLTRNGDTIEHNGYVFNEESFKKAIMNGNSRALSAEISNFGDSATGKIIGKRIKRVCFVPNPAIDGTETEISTFKFSAPEVIMTETESQDTTTSQEPKTEITATPSTLDITKIVEEVSAGISKKYEEQINVLKNEIESLKSNPGKEFLTKTPGKRGRPKKVTNIVNEESNEESEDGESILTEAQYVDPVGKEVFDEYAKVQIALQEKDNLLKQERQRVESIHQKQFDDLVSELKNRNASVESFITPLKGMKIEDQISALRAYREQVIKSQPMTSSSTSDIKIGSEGGQPNSPESLMDRARLAGIDQHLRNIPAHIREKIAAKFNTKIGV